MATLDVTPETLRAAGSDIAAERDELEEASGDAQLGGAGSHMQLSTGNFGPGVRAQRELARALTGVSEAQQLMSTNCSALSAALYILADVYTSADHEQALEFAFTSPGADQPAGLPAYVDPESTLLGEPAGGTAAPGSGGGESTGTTNRYSEYVDLHADSHRVEYVHATSHHRSIVEHHDDDGNLQYRSVSNTVVYADGSTRYYTDSTDSNGDVTRSGEFDVGPEGPPFDPAELIRRSMEELKELD